MEAETEENSVLRRGIRDLVALTTLPAVWAGSQPYDIAESLSDILITRLHLDLVYVYLKRTHPDAPLELARTSERLITGDEAREIGQALAPWLKADVDDAAVSLANPVGGERLQIAIIPVGHEGIDGFVVAGTRPSKAPTELDRLLLSVAATEAVTALRQAQLLVDLRAANQAKDTLLVKERAARAEAQQTAARFDKLQELTSRLSQALTAEEIGSVILRAGIRLFGSDRGAVYQMSDSGKSLCVLDISGGYAHAGFGQDRAQPDPIPLLSPMPVTDSVRTQEMVWIEDGDALLSRYPQLEQRYRDEKMQAVVVVPFLIRRQVLGCLELAFESPRQMTENEANLLSAVAQQCVQALERARLNEQAQIAAAVEERQRLARDLHDAVSQVLFAATVNAEASVRAWERNPQRAFEQLEQVVMLNRAAMGEMRTLLLELRPEAIVRSRLNQLLTYLVEAARGHRQIDSQLVIEGVEESFPPDVLICLYRIAQESISNILKHSEASEFRVYVQHQPDQVRLRISDNGQGFDTGELSPGLGLGSIRERAAIMSATLDITSADGAGTEIAIVWPRPARSYQEAI